MYGHDVELLRTCAMYLCGSHADEARRLTELAERIEEDLTKVERLKGQLANTCKEPGQPPQGAA